MRPSDEAPAASGSAARDVDLWIGLLLILVGGAAFREATGFDAASRTFPLVVSGLLTLSGLGLVLRCLRSGPNRPLPGREIGAVGLCATLLVLWVLALGAGLGFALSTFVLQAGLLWLSGQRNPLRVALLAALITAAAYLLFVMVLDVRLPRSFLSFLAPGL